MALCKLKKQIFLSVCKIDFDWISQMMIQYFDNNNLLKVFGACKIMFSLFQSMVNLIKLVLKFFNH